MTIYLVTRYEPGEIPEILWFTKTLQEALNLKKNHIDKDKILIEKGTDSWLDIMEE